MKIVFFGTPEFAVPSLTMLVREGYAIAGVITQPDRKKDRGQRLTPPPVKQKAMEFNLPVFQFEKIKSPEALETLRALKPDLMVTAAFGQILSKEILDIPPLGCINVHASLLPEYRGASPVEWAIMKGEKITGITTMMTDIGLDTGDILLKRILEIGHDETGEELTQRLSVLGAEVLSDTLKLVQQGKALRVKQNENKMSYYPMLNKETGRINWLDAAESIRNLCRALDGGMGAYTFLKGEKLKIYKTRTVEWLNHAEAGKVLCSSPKEGFIVRAGDAALEILELQLPGSKRMAAKDLLRGRNIPVGTVLGR